MSKKSSTTRRRMNETGGFVSEIGSLIRSMLGVARSDRQAGRRRAVLCVVALVVLPLVAIVPAMPAGALSHTSRDGRLTLDYTPYNSAGTALAQDSATGNYTGATDGDSITFRVTLTNNSSETLYRDSSSTTLTGCGLTFPTRIYARQKLTTSCTVTLTATTVSAVAATYFSYNEWYDPYGAYRRSSRSGVQMTVQVTPKVKRPAFGCQVPAVYIGANDALRTGETPKHPGTVLYQQIQEPGSTGFTEVGTTKVGGKHVQYNAMVWNSVDQYIYAISSVPQAADSTWLKQGHLLRIDANGQAEDLGLITGQIGSYRPWPTLSNPYPSSYQADLFTEEARGGITSGALHNGTYYVSNASSSGNAWMFRIDLEGILAGTATKTATRIASSSTFRTNDYVVKGNYLWGIRNPIQEETDADNLVILRYRISDGVVTSFEQSPHFGLTAGKRFGAAWLYGNGNLGFSDNGGSGVYQISVGNPDAPTFTLVNHLPGPGSYNNDGTNCYTVNDVDLRLKKTASVPTRIGKEVTWRFTVTNEGKGVSSGSVLTDEIPKAYSKISIDGQPFTKAEETIGGCTLGWVSKQLTCQIGVLMPNESVTIEVTATAPMTQTCLTNSARIFGNEHDPNTSNNTDSAESCINDASLDIAKTAGSVEQKQANVYEATYTVTVRNNGTTPGTYTQITDAPRFTVGTTVDSVSWSGGPDSAETTAAPLAPKSDLQAGGDFYLVGTASEKTLAAGSTHTYTVTVLFTVTSLGSITQCNGEPGFGFFNQVSLPQEDRSETLHTENNSACANPPSWIDLGKTAVAGSIAGPSSQGEYTVDYKVSVSNSGLAAGSYGPITDTLSFDPKFTPVAATWTNEATKATGTTAFGAGTSNFTFTVGAANTAVAANATHTYTVKVTYQVNPANVNAPITECAATPAPGKGLYNRVALPAGQEHALGTKNEAPNDACITPTSPVPVIDLVKEGWTDSNHTSPATTLEGPATVYYTYKVSLPTGAQEPLHTVTLKDDIYSLGLTDAAGAAKLTTTEQLTTAANTVTHVTENEKLTLTSGDTNKNGLLEVGETWVYTYASTAPITETTKNVATVSGTGVISSKQASKTDDWTVVMTPRQITVQKLGTDKQNLGGAEFALFDTDPTAAGATPMTKGITVNPTDASAFTSTGLTFGKDYWLVETKAPEGHELLAHPVKFTITGDGVQLTEKIRHGKTVAVSSDNVFGITVTDAPRATLPQAGGDGAGALPWTALVLLVGALGAYRRTTATTSTGGE